jgi:phage recombination protein Bet
MVKKKDEIAVVSDSDMVKTLQTSLYSGGSEASIMMVINYCREAKLDPLLKPVHIVPMWDSKTGKMRDVIMPGIGHYRTQAERSKFYAGITEPEFGEERESGGVKFPHWCKITVKRLLPNGKIGEFTAKEFWLENYAIKGGKEKDKHPNAMWTKRPYGQIAKCTEAQALRKAFPELLGAAPTAEEMMGKEIDITDEVESVSVEMPTSKTGMGNMKVRSGDTDTTIPTGVIEDPTETEAEQAKLTAKEIEGLLIESTSMQAIQEIFPMVDAMEAGEIKDHLMIIGKTKFKELKKKAA